MKSYMITIDQSTSGTKVLLVDEQGVIVRKYAKEHTQYYPRPGWVEHDPVEIIHNVYELVKKAKESLVEEEVTAVAITNQRETAVLWDENTQMPIYNAVVWQCRRSVSLCETLKEEQKEDMVYQKTGLKLDPYFSASKWKWMLEEVQGAKELVQKGQLLAGTMDAWLIYQLTQGKEHKTDVTNASRTLLYNIHDLKWDNELVEVFGLEGIRLPEVCDCNSCFGQTDFNGILEKEIPIYGVIGDSQGALYAQKCTEKGMAKATYGTGTSILVNTGEQPISKQDGLGLVTAIAWSLSGKCTYALEGIINCSGDTLNWLKDQLGMFESTKEIEPLCLSLEDNEGVYLVPALVGYGIPYWKSDARASLSGMTRSTGKAHVVRAGVESIVYQIYDAMKAMEKSSGILVSSLRVDGGATVNEFLMQFQADILGIEVSASKVQELSAMGAYYIAATRVWSKEFTDAKDSHRLYLPKMKEEQRCKNLNGWQEAVVKCL